MLTSTCQHTPFLALQVQTFLLAGYETTASSLAFAIYCIATNPQGALQPRLQPGT